MSRLADYRVDGGVALVTGAAGGIGSALSERLVRDGSNLALVDRNEEGLHEVAERLRVRRPDRRITVMVADLAAESAPAEVVERSLAEHGRLTLVVNNAGVALAGRFEQVSVADVDWLLAINLRSVLAVTSAAFAAPGSRLAPAPARNAPSARRFSSHPHMNFPRKWPREYPPNIARRGCRRMTKKRRAAQPVRARRPPV